jgi:hypothetical protein
VEAAVEEVQILLPVEQEQQGREMLVRQTGAAAAAQDKQEQTEVMVWK